MATAAVTLAPVLTPRTLGVLADSLERDQFSDKAQALRQLLPFVEGVVERCFLPLIAPPRRSTFSGSFNRLSRDFEPIRLYLNLQILTTLDNRNLLGVYEQVLLHALDAMLSTAREMDMGPDLISAAVRDYLKILRAALQVANNVNAQPATLNVEQLMNVADWFRAATRFDYGLTAVFLILELAIPTPTPADKGALLSACKKSLIEFAQSTSRVVINEYVHHAVRNLETAHIQIRVAGRGVRDTTRRPIVPRPGQPGFGPSRRQTEIEWLKRNKDLADRYGGQWIALEKDELVANDQDYRKVREAVIEKGIKRPLIIFVPLKDNGGFMGI